MNEQDNIVKKNLKRAKRVQLAVVGGVCIALGFLLSMLTSLFPGLDTDEGKKQESVQTSTQPSSPALTPTINKEEEKAPEKDEPVETVHVSVVDDKYLLLTKEDGKETEKEIPLEAILEKAKKAKGNDDGIKIQIKVLKSARYLTKTSLEEELEKAGISNASIAIVKE